MSILNSFDPEQRLVIDVETISYDDKRGGLRPYHGDRVCGISVSQGLRSIYMPLRHRHDQSQLYPLEAGLKEFREFGLKCKHVGNVNLKFDLHCMWQDRIDFPNATLYDLGTEARIVNNQVAEFGKYAGYSLEALTNKYNTQYKKQADPIHEACERIGTKDYGAAPIEIISEYAQYDTLSAEELWSNLDSKLPIDSVKVWKEEQKFTRLLFESERDGLPLNTALFRLIQVSLMKEMQILNEKIGVIAGNPEFNPASPKQLDEYFRGKGIAPVAWNIQDDGSKTPSWGKDALSMIIDPIATLVQKYNARKVACSTFAMGWVNQVASDGKIHGHYNQSGTKTGRISSSEPNLQNPPEWAMLGLEIPEGEIGVKFDYSQIEYRIFAHYAKDEELLKLYQTNPKVDFHQIIADRLGMGGYRKIIKPINFGILYGMGKGKMKKQLAKTIHDLQEDMVASGKEKQYGELLNYLESRYGSSSDKSLEIIGENIIKEYHRLTPAVHKLLKFVENIISHRGNIRNYYNRYYQFDLDRAYVALNYLCQGTAADMFKERCNAIFYDPRIIALGARMRMNIHDAIYATMPIAAAQEYWDIVRVTACDVPGFRVPVLIDGEVAYGNWGTTSKIKDDSKVLETFNALRTKHASLARN